MSLVKYNKGIDFFHSLSYYVHGQKPSIPPTGLKNPKEKLYYWEEAIKNVPLLQRQQLLYLLESTILVSILTNAIHYHGIETVLSMDEALLRESLCMELGLDAKKVKEVELEEAYKNFLDDYHLSIQELDYEIVHELIHESSGFLQEFLPAAKAAYQVFEDKLYGKAKDQILSKLTAFQNLHQENPRSFMEEIMIIGYERLSSKIDELPVYMLYFAANNFGVSFDPDFVIFSEDIYDKIIEQKHSKEYAEFLKTLADPTRYEMVKLLAKRPHYGAELAEALGLTTATVSHHVSKLTMYRIIKTDRIEQNRVYFSVDQDRLNSLIEGITKDLLGSA